MKKTLFALALSLCMFLNPAYAATYDATISGDGYIFQHSFSGDYSFNDYIAFSTEGIQGIVASISGTGETFTLTGFNLLDENKSLIQTGTLVNSDAQISFGSLKSMQEGSFYLQVMGQSTGATAGFTGNITLASAVPEPETLSLLLPGILLLAARSRRKH